MDVKNLRTLTRELPRLSADLRRLRAAFTALRLFAGLDTTGNPEAIAVARQELATAIRDMQMRLALFARVIDDRPMDAQEHDRPAE